MNRSRKLYKVLDAVLSSGVLIVLILLVILGMIVLSMSMFIDCLIGK